MRNLFFLFLFVSAFSINSFSQNGKPQAYLISSGDPNTVSRPKSAYLISGGDRNGSTFTRPRVVKYAPANSGDKSKVNISYALERRAFELINMQREKYGLAPLAWSDDVARIARLHSQNMATFNFFSHAGLDGLMVNNRADSLGISRWRSIGENIAYTQGMSNPVEFAVESWMRSPAHRDNLLNARWKESAIGIAVTSNGTYYFTEVFLLK